MTTKEDERLVELLDEADAALDEALPLFRRAREFMMFARGADPGLARDDPALIRIRDRITSIAESLARQLLLARDRHGLPLDSEPEIRGQDGEPRRLGIGLRGGRLWAPLAEFQAGLEGGDAHRCVAGLERIRSFVDGVRHDILPESSATVTPAEGRYTAPQVAELLADAGETMRDGRPITANAFRKRIRKARGASDPYARLSRIRDREGRYPKAQASEIIADVARAHGKEIEGMREVLRAVQAQKRGLFDEK